MLLEWSTIEAKTMQKTNCQSKSKAMPCNRPDRRTFALFLDQFSIVEGELLPWRLEHKHPRSVGLIFLKVLACLNSWRGRSQSFDKVFLVTDVDWPGPLLLGWVAPNRWQQWSKPPRDLPACMSSFHEHFLGGLLRLFRESDYDPTEQMESHSPSDALVVIWSHGTSPWNLRQWFKKESVQSE